jgi:hypothetical protein
MQDKLVEDLQDMAELYGEMRMTPEAFAWGTEWYKNLVERPEFRSLQGERFQGYYARKQTHLHKIAIVLSVATGNSMLITEKHLQTANGFLASMEKDYGQVLEYVQAGTAYSSAKIEISRIIQEKGSVDKTDLYGEVSTVVAGQDFEKIMGDLVKANMITQLVTGGKVKVSWKRNTSMPVQVLPFEPQ